MAMPVTRHDTHFICHYATAEQTCEANMDRRDEGQVLLPHAGPYHSKPYRIRNRGRWTCSMPSFFPNSVSLIGF